MSTDTDKTKFTVKDVRPTTFIMLTDDGDLQFFSNGKVALELKGNGEIYVQGRKADNDKAFVDSFKQWFNEVLGIMKDNNV